MTVAVVEERETIQETLRQLLKDFRVAREVLSDEEARFLVDLYYQTQEHRIALAGQMRSMDVEPHSMIQWVYETMQFMEKQIEQKLGRYSMQSEVGQWSRSITGIGPVLAAGLIAYNPMTWTDKDGLTQEQRKVTQLWRYAGLDPTSSWEKGQIRPWNARLKTLCWKIGESFNKQKFRDSDFYGKLIDQRKRYEWRKNIAGEYSEQAINKAKVVGKSTEAYPWYAGTYILQPADIDTCMEGTAAIKEILPYAEADEGSGVNMLPPGHIHARAKRWAVKLFLAHWHAVAHECAFGEPSPTPYAIAHLGHVDEIPPPNWPLA